MDSQEQEPVLVDLSRCQEAPPSEQGQETPE